MAEAYPLVGPSTSPRPEDFGAPPESLRQAIAAAESGLTRLGLAFWCPERDEAWVWQEGAYSAASLIKLPLAIAALKLAEQGELDLDEGVQVAPLPEDDEAEWDDVGFAPAGKKVAWAKLLDRALTESDNAATNAIIDRLGLRAIAPLCEALGLKHTALRRRMLDAKAREAGLDNTTSPIDMLRLMAALTTRSLLEEAGTQDVKGWMGQQRHRDQMAPGLHSPWRFHHKTGELPGLRADAGWLSYLGWPQHCFVVGIAQGPEALASEALAAVMRAIVAREEALQTRRNLYDLWVDAQRRGRDPRLTWVQTGLNMKGEDWALAGHSTEESSFHPPAELGIRVEVVRPVPKPMAVVAPALFLRSESSSMANLDDQGRYGDRFELLWDPELEDRWVFGRLEDGYLGWAKLDHLVLAPDWRPTHQLESLLSPVAREGLPPFQLSATSRVRQRPDGAWEGPEGNLLAFAEGTQLRPLNAPAGGPEDLVAFAKACLGLPYLWGGTTTWGLDCSGLVQLAHRLYGAELRRDADQQQAELPAVATWQALQPGDLCFFPGHVGMMVAPGRFVHATNGVGFTTENSFDPADPLFHPGLAASFSGGGRSPLGKALAQP